MRDSERVGAIIVAAGTSTRFGRDKLSEPLLGKPVLFWTLEAFATSPLIDEVVLVTSRGGLAVCEDIVDTLAPKKPVRVVFGGARRQDSVCRGLDALSECRWVLVHDGARPLVSAALIEAGLAAVRRTGAAVPGVPLADTVKQVAPDDAVVATLERAALRAIQTPQVFAFELLRRAHREVGVDVTDDAAMVEAVGGHVVIFPGDPANVKITSAHDLYVCEALLRARLAQ